ncbi:MAG TPA: hemolysin family protein [Candidatus Cloacimonadota bacterium]|nr:hemolysin family protein [Candidatus Cloacimonadales bacterium]HPY96817.1 hemolysin family protein [Candidatus Cloacimonadota bacterium]HQB41375.1 hemolysin family protein [Candidatus Cloacimonadota bacterium]
MIYILLIIFFLISFFFSGIETGFVTLDRFKLEQESKNDKRKKGLLEYIQNSDRIFGTVLIGNNISNVIIASLATVLFKESGIISAKTGTIIVTVLVLIFGELIPKTIFRDYAEKLVYLFYPLFNLIYILLKPLVYLVSLFNDFLKRRFNIAEYESYHFFTKDDVALILAETADYEGIEENAQKEMLEDALEFNQLLAKSIMIPRTEIIAIEDTMKVDEILAMAREEGYTRYPVYHTNLDEITGVLIIYDLISKMDNKELTAKELQREVFFAPETMNITNMLQEMQTNKRSMAVVVDSYGGTAGIATIEDIIEELVGDFEDEYDEEEREIEIINKNTLIVQADVEVNTLIDDYDIDIPKGDYVSIAGYVIDKLERIPARGCIISEADFQLEILQVTSRKIEKIRIVKFSPETNFLNMRRNNELI